MGLARHEDGQRERCDDCRYWFERCCHALALADGSDRTPRSCCHFARPPAPAAVMRPESASC